LRLTRIGHEIGLASNERLKKLIEKEKDTDRALKTMKNESVTPEEANKVLISNNSSTIKQKTRIDKILSRPQIKLNDLTKINSVKEKLSGINKEAMEQSEIQIKYNGYIDRERETAKKLDKLEGIRIPNDFDYSKLAAISSESREKLNAVQPNTIGQASRISGVTPSDISVLLVFMGR
jgi:tRNA uridine 5-carboxymethylaminomethyl modification enzyme